MSVIESYSTVKGGIGPEALKGELLSQGCEIIRVETDVMVSRGEEHYTLGDRVIVRRFSKDEREKMRRQ